MKLYNTLLLAGVKASVLSIFDASLNQDTAATGNKSFFQLGGDSLQAIDCIIMIEKRYGPDLTLEDLLMQTAADLAGNVACNGRSDMRTLMDFARGGWVLIAGKDQ